MLSRKTPLFNQARTSELSIKPAIASEIKQMNMVFEDQLMKFTSQKKVDLISKEFASRQQKLENAMEHNE